MKNNAPLPQKRNAVKSGSEAGQGPLPQRNGCGFSLTRQSSVTRLKPHPLSNFLTGRADHGRSCHGSKACLRRNRRRGDDRHESGFPHLRRNRPICRHRIRPICLHHRHHRRSYRGGENLLRGDCLRLLLRGGLDRSRVGKSGRGAGPGLPARWHGRPRPRRLRQG